MVASYDSIHEHSRATAAAHDHAAADTTLHALLPRFEAWQRVKHYAEITISDRSWCLGHFVAWADARSIDRPHQLTLPVLERYAAALHEQRRADGRRLDPRTQALRLTHLRSFFKWLTRQKYILLNPAAEHELPRFGRRLPATVLSAAEADAVMAQPDVSHVLGLRDRAILETFYSAGVRRSELCNLGMHDVDASRGTLFVRGGKGDRDRWVAIGERALSWIETYLTEARPALATPPDDATLFLSNKGKALRPNYLTQLCGRYIDAADIGKRGSCHLFRHTMATLMHENGADVRHVQSQLGHADLATTAIYTHVSVRKLKEVHAETHPAG
jgi:integrase/recombinase XerD